MQIKQINDQSWLLEYRDTEELIATCSVGSRIYPEIEVKVTHTGIRIAGELLTWSEIDLARDQLQDPRNQIKFL